MMGGDRSDEKGGNQPGDDRRIAHCMYNFSSLVLVSPSQPLTEWILWRNEIWPEADQFFELFSKGQQLKCHQGFVNRPARNLTVFPRQRGEGYG